MDQKPLFERMREYATAKGWPEHHLFFFLALDLETTAKSGDVRSTLHAWARARKAWCAETGEPLV